MKKSFETCKIIEKEIQQLKINKTYHHTSYPCKNKKAPTNRGFNLYIRI